MNFFPERISKISIFLIMGHIFSCISFSWFFFALSFFCQFIYTPWLSDGPIYLIGCIPASALTLHSNSPNKNVNKSRIKVHTERAKIPPYRTRIWSGMAWTVEYFMRHWWNFARVSPLRTPHTVLLLIFYVFHFFFFFFLFFVIPHFFFVVYILFLIWWLVRLFLHIYFIRLTM